MIGNVVILHQFKRIKALNVVETIFFSNVHSFSGEFYTKTL